MHLNCIACSLKAHFCICHIDESDISYCYVLRSLCLTTMSYVPCVLVLSLMFLTFYYYDLYSLCFIFLMFDYYVLCSLCLTIMTYIPYVLLL